VPICGTGCAKIKRLLQESTVPLFAGQEGRNHWHRQAPDDLDKQITALLATTEPIAYRCRAIIKRASTSKHYRDTRASIIEAAAAIYEKDRNSPQIPDYLIPVKTPWSSGRVHARLAYDQHIIEQYLNRVE
jgi:hypothetical protein